MRAAIVMMVGAFLKPVGSGLPAGTVFSAFESAALPSSPELPVPAAIIAIESPRTISAIETFSAVIPVETSWTAFAVRTSSTIIGTKSVAVSLISLETSSTVSETGSAVAATAISTKSAVRTIIPETP